MKLTVEKNILLDVLQKVQSIVALRTTLPILSNVLLEATNGKLKLTTTDLEVSLQTSIDVEVIEEGSTTLPARRFFSICRDLPSHQIDLSMNNEKEEIIIKSGSFEGKLGGLPKGDFPEIPEFKNSTRYVETRGFFRDGSVSPRPIRYHWCCNAETYWLIGEGMGQAMIKILKTRS